MSWATEDITKKRLRGRELRRLIVADRLDATTLVGLGGELVRLVGACDATAMREEGLPQEVDPQPFNVSCMPTHPGLSLVAARYASRGPASCWLDVRRVERGKGAGLKSTRGEQLCTRYMLCIFQLFLISYGVQTEAAGPTSIMRTTFPTNRFDRCMATDDDRPTDGESEYITRDEFMLHGFTQIRRPFRRG